MTQPIIEWTDRRVRLLREMWEKGASASEIAAAMGHPAQRSAVIAKARRLRLPTHQNARPKRSPQAIEIPRVDHRRVNTPKQQSVFAAREGKIKAIDPADSRYLNSDLWKPTPEAKMLGLLQLTDHTCKWPMGTPGEPGFGFCGQHVAELPRKHPSHPPRRTPYCAHHHNASITKEIEDAETVDRRYVRGSHGHHDRAG